MKWVCQTYLFVVHASQQEIRHDAAYHPPLHAEAMVGQDSGAYMARVEDYR